MGSIRGYEDFYAICDHMPGKEQTLRVGGKVNMSSGGWSAKLVPHPGPTGINPKILVLDLILDRASVGTDAFTTIEVEEYKETSPAFDYEQVEFHVLGVDGEEPPPIMPVEHVH